ncbi:hypothetical protein LTR78_004886 [Recurvomyces mirabilis]|uniref:Uncharacterized protein n=1 Tax=Recurvomyces mirabilis TaxID=574656 RepID=A0AAE0WPF3_9PEZI|nr:hypothetical protein LTR78_004886 [Recurvomyces mirabilis]KAK5158056.1 hypothetical protein LTS14_003979 [Recurvomyces mirabilis]
MKLILSDIQSLSYSDTDVMPTEDILELLDLANYPTPIFNTPAPAEWKKPVAGEGLLLDRHKKYVQE